MDNIIPLKCSACGASLKSNSQNGQFTCPSCGSEYLVPHAAFPAFQSPAASTAQPAPVPVMVKQAGLKTKTEVLLQLLQRVPDSNQLNILLETSNLLSLLLTHGYSAERVELELRTGKIPGQLLLELLDLEPNPEVLLRQLGKLPSNSSVPVPPNNAPSQGIASDFKQQMEINRRLLYGGGPTTSQEKLQLRVFGGMFIFSGIVLGGIGTWLAFRPEPIINSMVISLIICGPVLILMGGFILFAKRSPFVKK